jgi:hypothetical protein
MKEDGSMMTRRQAIRGAASVVGGTIAATQFTAFMSRAAFAADEGSPPQFFDENRFALVERIVDLMIPETDTPGATAAGVHYFIDLMLDEWASADRQRRFRNGVDGLAARLSPGDRDFLAVSTDEQLVRLKALDKAAFTENGDGDFFREFKRLALFGYYSSEAGATVELQYEALTPDYKACVPIDDIGRAWFWLGFRHGL